MVEDKQFNIQLLKEAQIMGQITIAVLDRLGFSQSRKLFGRFSYIQKLRIVRIGLVGHEAIYLWIAIMTRRGIHFGIPRFESLLSDEKTLGDFYSEDTLFELSRVIQRRLRFGQGRWIGNYYAIPLEISRLEV